jgi:hypothetical protein
MPQKQPYCGISRSKEAKMSKTRDRNAAGSVIERLYLSVETLCTGPGNVRSRLEDAIRNHLDALQWQDFSSQADFKWIMGQATKYRDTTPDS